MRPSTLALVSLSSVSFLLATAAAETPKSPPKDSSKKAAPAPAPAPKLAADELAPNTKTLAAIQDGSLALIPVVLDTAPVEKPDDDMLVLDQAMKEKLVRIHEVGDGGSVNTLKLTNKSKQPVFLLVGEVILGGKQDRIIGKNTIIPAKSTLEVPVFCVEHGRWNDEGAKGEFKSAGALAHGRLRAKASFENQSEVWSEVADKNDKRKVANSTDTYRKVAAQQVDGTLESSEKAVKAALAKLPEADRKRMVGYAVAINGKVATVDVFTSPALFRKLEAKLLRSYLTEAVDVKAAKDAKAAGVAEVKQFMADADAAADEQAAYENELASTKVKGGKFSDKASVKRKKAAPPASAANPSPVDTEEDVFMNYSAK